MALGFIQFSLSPEAIEYLTAKKGHRLRHYSPVSRATSLYNLANAMTSAF
jgi:hypothetical protein